MRNSETGKFEVKKVFTDTLEEVVGTGDTKEAAYTDLKKNLEPYKVNDPRIGLPGYKGKKYASKFVPIEGQEGFVSSPGYEWITGEDGKPYYRFNPDRKAQVYASPRLAKLLGPNIAKEDVNEEPKAE